MQFIDLQAQYREVQDAVEAAVLRVLRGGQYIMGPEVQQLERQLAQFVGVDHAISCASGTDALVMALMAKEIGPGDAVFTVPFTFIATAEAIALTGATPVFVDIAPSSFNIDPSALGRAVRALREGNCDMHPLPRIARGQLERLRPRAVIAVDLFGAPADYRAINAVASAEQLTIIEDAAQSFGASQQGKRAGALAEIGCTSFFPAKPLGCYGDGGALFTGDAEIAAVLRSIRVHGQGQHKYDNVRIGVAGRLDTVQAAVLLAKLPIFERELRQRQAVARHYSDAIDAAGLPLETPRVPDQCTSAWAQYSLLARSGEARERLISALAEAEIPSAIYYPKPLHLQGAFAQLGYRAGDFPVSEDAADRVFSLPMSPYLEEGAIDRIVTVLGQARP